MFTKELKRHLLDMMFESNKYGPGDFQDALGWRFVPEQFNEIADGADVSQEQIMTAIDNAYENLDSMFLYKSLLINMMLESDTTPYSKSDFSDKCQNASNFESEFGRLAAMNDDVNVYQWQLLRYVDNPSADEESVWFNTLDLIYMMSESGEEGSEMKYDQKDFETYLGEYFNAEQFKAIADGADLSQEQIMTAIDDAHKKLNSMFLYEYLLIDMMLESEDARYDANDFQQAIGDSFNQEEFAGLAAMNDKEHVYQQQILRRLLF
jgi:hypothetical protein